MELRAIERSRRNEQLSKTTAAKTEPSARPETSAGPQTLQARSKADRLSVSRQALAFLEEQNRQVMERAREEAARRDADPLDGLSEEKDALDFMDKQLKMLNKCQKIAARIMAGDKVPPEDERYLMEHDQEGYKMALALRRPKKHPKEYKSVLDDEDRGKTAGSGETEGPSAVSEPSAGSETGNGTASGGEDGAATE